MGHDKFDMIHAKQINVGSNDDSPKFVLRSNNVTGSSLLDVGDTGDGFAGNAINVLIDHADASGRAIRVKNDGTGPSLFLQQAQDVEVIDFDGCTDGGTGHTTVAGSIKVQMPNGSTGYINVYT